MNKKVILLSILFLGVLLSGIQGTEKIKNYGDTAFAASNLPVYQPPAEENEKRRRIGGTKVASHRGLTRGLGTDLARKLATGLASKKSDEKTELAEKNKKPPEYLAPLAPEHVGLTLNKQPVIYFYIAPEWSDKIEFTLNQEGILSPVLKTKIDYQGKTGILAVDLKKYNISLKPHLEYEWFVSVMTDPKDRTTKMFGSAVIKYIKPPEKTTDQIRNTPKEKLPYLYAEKGYFYDAIESLSKLIQTSKNTNLKIQRAALLEQVELPFAAEHDRKL
jgi:hypothetical protein